MPATKHAHEREPNWVITLRRKPATQRSPATSSPAMEPARCNPAATDTAQRPRRPGCEPPIGTAYLAMTNVTARLPEG